MPAAENMGRYRLRIVTTGDGTDALRNPVVDITFERVSERLDGGPPLYQRFDARGFTQRYRTDGNRKSSAAKLQELMLAVGFKNGDTVDKLHGRELEAEVWLQDGALMAKWARPARPL